ncbi:MAG: ATP-binding cassette domain-containing protein [Parvularcula sp.]|jgi:ATP-binding cassette subfamily B protein|nr:ATP-binding cassette domain-containing protein [Parvularcula sp.]
MDLFSVLTRVVRTLKEPRLKIVTLVGSGMVVALIQVVEAILFGRVVNGLVEAEAVGRLFTIWVVLGAIGIGLSVTTALAADRLAHRNKLRTMTEAFEAALGGEVGGQSVGGMGAMIRNILVGCDAFFHVWLNLLREFVPALTALLVLVPIALTMSVTLTLTLMVLIVAYLTATIFIMDRTYANQQMVDRQYRTLSSRITDVMSNANVVHAFTRLHQETQAIRGMGKAILAKQYPVLNWWAVLNVFTQASATITIVSVLLVGSILVGRQALTIGEVVTFTGFATLLIARLQQTAGAITRLYPQVPVMQALIELLDQGSGEDRDTSLPPLPGGPGNVRFENVSFHFPGTQIGVQGIDLEVQAGETVAIVGSTGAGKTTLLALLQRIFAPTAGRIFIDEADVQQHDIRSVRRNIAVVAQNAGLFDRSIADNLRIGKLEASDEELYQALAMAELSDLIERKEGGLAFTIGEGGKALSGGERQRLSIARALLKEARILILDEATSALDTVTEAKIQRALEVASKDRTTFVIAHRLSTIRNADRVIVLEAGRIVQSGPPSELSQKEGPFRQFLQAAETDRRAQVKREVGKIGVDANVS